MNVSSVGVAISSPSGGMMKTNNQTNWLKRLPSIGAAIVIYGFFLPWVMASCSFSFGDSSPGISASGYEIASGNIVTLNDVQEIGSMFGFDEEFSSADSSIPPVWLILVLGIIGLMSLNGKGSGTIVAVIVGFLGIIAMSFAYIQLVQVKNDLSMPGLDFQILRGFWLTWIGYIWLAFSAIMIRKRKFDVLK